MNLNWRHKKTEPFFSQGKDTTRSNFSREERSEVAILIREALQNPLDARQELLEGPVQVHLRNLEPGQYDGNYLAGIFNAEYRQRIKTASGIDLPDATAASVFVMEDFGTKGLLGDIENYDADGADQNWNAFWHREGEGAKGRASNGGAGQGKVTYFGHSNASAVLGLTVRASDGRRLVMGRAAFLRDYQFQDGSKYYRSAYWTVSDTTPLPEENPSELDRFCSAFGLSRDAVTPGLSLVVPFAKPFSHADAVTSVILDFYMPIAAGVLEVMIGTEKLGRDTIDTIASQYLTDPKVIEANSSFTERYRAFVRGVIDNPPDAVALKTGWNKDRVISVDAFPDGEIEKLRVKLENCECICIKLPLVLKFKNGSTVETSFDVFLEVPADLDRNEDSFVRRDLLIGAETHVMAGSFVQKTRSLTWIQNKELSDFLLSAEEPTHLKWNASLARDKGDYQAPDVALRSIRQAVPRLLSVLLQGSERRDVKSLARYFSRPTPEQTGKPGKTGPKKPKDGPTGPVVKPPAAIKRPFKIEAHQDEIRVSSNVPGGITGLAKPFYAALEMAYEGLDHDPFTAYDPYDFDISQERLYPVSVADGKVISRAANCIEFEVTGDGFFLSVGGFDPNMRLRARLKKTHSTAATDQNEDEFDEA